jgi:DNA primase
MAGDNIQVQQVRDATDIVRLIGEQVTIKPKGKEYMGVCPFHNDKSPSMHVSPQKQIYKCFACGAGGDVFGFVMNYHKMTFVESLKYLAERANIKLENRFEKKGAESESGVARTKIYEANVQAVGFYRALLSHPEHGKIAREYIAKRKISAEMVEAFQLGYAPDRWDGMVMMIRSKGWNLAAFEAAGLIGAKNGGQGHFDKLRHRLIFPIIDVTGRPIAFGGRKIRAEDEPKYLNSPETPVFNKSQTLYGLHLAKKVVQETRTAVIVEGYTDVIACHQAGVKNVMATLGTALTLQHVKHLRHFCDRVILIYDGDEAGLKASDKAVSVFLEGELDVYIAVIPGGADPADLFEKPEGMEIWQKAIKDAKDSLSYQFERVKQKLQGAETITGRQKVAEEYLTKLVEMGVMGMSPVRKVLIEQRVGELLGLTPGDVDALLKRLAQSVRPKRQDPDDMAGGAGLVTGWSGGGGGGPVGGGNGGGTGGRGMGGGPVLGGGSGGGGGKPPGYAQVSNNAVAGSGAGVGGGVGAGGAGPAEELMEEMGDAYEPSAGELAEHNSAVGGVGDGVGGGLVAGSGEEMTVQGALARLPAHRRQMVVRAERLLIGTLLVQNELFHGQALSDGRMVDESIGAYDLTDGVHQKLYEQVYDRLAEGKGVSIQSMLTELASQEAHDLAGRLAQIEEETQQLSLGKAEKVRELFVDSAGVLVGFRLEYEKTSSQNGTGGGLGAKIKGDVGVASRKIAEAKEALAGNTTPKIRIARIGKQRFT